tara:strand:- start:2950 stop:3216 length:267 start_codon:yes stop_codon:yes gene_type:complete
MLTMKRQDLQSLNFTRRHFEFVANLVGEIGDDHSREEVTADTCVRFKLAFPHFNEDKFRSRVQDVHDECWTPSFSDHAMRRAESGYGE